MRVFNQRPPRAIYLCLMFMMLIVGCNPDSSGAKETEQLDNDEDPTAIEMPRSQEPLLSESIGKMNDQGEFVVIQDFDQSTWPKISKDFNLGEVTDASENNITSNIVGADAWKSWGDYQYRIIYFSDGGSLKAKPSLKNKNNEEIGFSTQMMDSLRMEDLWAEIQRSSSTISKNYE